MGFNCFKTTEPLRGENLLLTTKSPGVCGTHLSDLGRMNGSVDIEAGIRILTGYAVLTYHVKSAKNHKIVTESIKTEEGRPSGSLVRTCC